MFSRTMVVALLFAAALGTVYAFAFGGARQAAVEAGGAKAKSACGCEVCKCPNCNGEFCTCDSCECVGCACDSAAKQAETGTRSAPSQPKGCCATSTSVKQARVSTVKAGCGCEVCKCPDCNGEFCTCETCECVGCGCAT